DERERRENDQRPEWPGPLGPFSAGGGLGRAHSRRLVAQCGPVDTLAAHAAAKPDAPALIEGERRLTWREYLDARNRLAHAHAPRVRHWVTIGRERRPWTLALDHLIAEGPPESVATDGGGNVGGSMIYTAGTTGKPKGALRRVVDVSTLRPRMAAFDLARLH